ncbi:MAG: hypothetical protein M4579_005682 [Chaenotheca gracillima]|nr:MAG: hypothetical protein M4579_005682 [Chaenotheca gracillima]
MSSDPQQPAQTQNVSARDAKDSLKNAATGLHGAGEAFRGTFNQAVNSAGRDYEAARQDELVAQKGLDEMRTSKEFRDRNQGQSSASRAPDQEVPISGAQADQQGLEPNPASETTPVGTTTDVPSSATTSGDGSGSGFSAMPAAAGEVRPRPPVVPGRFAPPMGGPKRNPAHEWPDPRLNPPEVVEAARRRQQQQQQGRVEEIKRQPEHQPPPLPPR